jgi:prolyl-tRNA editing enzyme YbaK/EbsC (Cys-tRNA(Pro) deacylase)
VSQGPELHERVRAALSAWQIPHRVLACDPEAADTAAFCARYGYPPESSLNTIVVAGKREPRAFAACVVQASGRLDVNKRVRGLLGVPRVSFASADDTVQATAMLVGGVTPIGLPEGWPIYVDEPIRALASVILGGGNRSTKIELDPCDLERIPGLQFVSALTLPR